MSTHHRFRAEPGGVLRGRVHLESGSAVSAFVHSRDRASRLVPQAPGYRAREPARRRGKTRLRPSIPRLTFIFLAGCEDIAVSTPPARFIVFADRAASRARD